MKNPAFGGASETVLANGFGNYFNPHFLNTQALPDAALSYALNGFKIFPCNGKVPLTIHGFKDASADLEVVTNWWKQWPSANIGLVTGIENHLLVIDVDGRWPKDWPPIPNVSRVNTYRGFHLYFDCLYNKDIPCRTKLHGHEVDVKANGGYVIAPPSLHSEGGRYEFV